MPTPPAPDLEENDPPPPAPPRGGLSGLLPRLPASQRRQTPPGATTPSEPTPGTPPGPVAPPAGTPGGPDQKVPDFHGQQKGKSSPGSTPDEELVPPETLAKAISQAVDIGLVLGGQAVGMGVSRARRLEHDQRRWTPTVEERKLVLDPATRIVARHVRGTVNTADAVDAALIAAGLGHFAMRAAYDMPVIPDVIEAKAKEAPRVD